MNRSPGQLRIVGGLLRRTPLRIAADVPDMRPTPDRVRETLFNWLGARIEGASCLDLFAGSGALGFEAASRGAGRVFLHDNDGRAIVVITDRIAQFALARDGAVQALAARLTASRREALAALAEHASAGRRFDVVFLDPPFSQHWFDRLATPLAAVLAPGAAVYVETGQALNAGQVSGWGWQLERQGRAGQVHYHLCSMIEESTP